MLFIRARSSSSSSDKDSPTRLYFFSRCCRLCSFLRRRSWALSARDFCELSQRPMLQSGYHWIVIKGQLTVCNMGRGKGHRIGHCSDKIHRMILGHYDRHRRDIGLLFYLAWLAKSPIYCISLLIYKDLPWFNSFSKMTRSVSQLYNYVPYDGPSWPMRL